MNKKTKEHAVRVLKEINEGFKAEVIKEHHISDLCNMDTGRNTGFAVILYLSNRFDYTNLLLNKWRNRLEAFDYVISVFRCRLQIRFNVMYDEPTQEP